MHNFFCQAMVEPEDSRYNDLRVQAYTRRFKGEDYYLRTRELESLTSNQVYKDYLDHGEINQIKII